MPPRGRPGVNIWIAAGDGKLDLVKVFDLIEHYLPIFNADICWILPCHNRDGLRIFVNNA